MTGIFRLIAILCTCGGLLIALSAQGAEHPTIRVAILKDIPQVTIRPVRGALIIRSSSDVRMQNRAASASVRAVNGSLRVNGEPYPGEDIVIEGNPALFSIGRSQFRGALHLYITGENTFSVINELDLEDYLAGLINSEISSNWPIEAVKAQAIAARTYALNQMARTNRANQDARYDVESTVDDQVYHGAHREDRRAYEGVRATTGMVLTRDGVIFPSFYHSTCGGYTENAHNVWLDMKPSPTTVDTNCKRSPYREWFLRIRKAPFIAILTRHGIIAPERLLMGISQTPFADSPRANEVMLYLDNGETTRVRASELRRIIGYNKLKSTWFNVGFEGDEVVFAGRGFGHGVGLCQWGAKGMAEAGHAYREILKHYYRDADIGRMY